MMTGEALPPLTARPWNILYSQSAAGVRRKEMDAADKGSQLT